MLKERDLFKQQITFTEFVLCIYDKKNIQKVEKTLLYHYLVLRYKYFVALLSIKVLEFLM